MKGGGRNVTTDKLSVLTDVGRLRNVAGVRRPAVAMPRRPGGRDAGRRWPQLSGPQDCPVRGQPLSAGPAEGELAEIVELGGRNVERLSGRVKAKRRPVERYAKAVKYRVGFPSKHPGRR